MCVVSYIGVRLISISLTVTILLAGNTAFYGQNPRDSTWYKNLGDLIWSKTRVEPKEALRLTDSMAVLAAKDGLPKRQNLCRYYYGVIYRTMGEYPRALLYLDSTRIFWKNENDLARTAHALYQIGTVKQGMGDLQGALTAMNENIALYRTLNSQQNVATSLNARGTIFRALGQPEKTRQNYGQALTLYRELDDSVGMVEVLHNLGNLHAESGERDSAYYYYDLTADLSAALGDERGLGYLYEALGRLHFTDDEYELAIAQLEKSLVIREKYDDKSVLVNTMLHLGAAHFKMQSFSKAKKYILPAMDLASKHRMRQLLTTGHRILARMAILQNNHDMALQHLDAFYALNDTLKDLSMAEHIAEIEAKHQVSEKAAEVQRLSLQNELSALQLSRTRVAFIATLVGSIALILFVCRLRALNQKVNRKNNAITEALQERELLLREIHHRVKNNLQIVSSLLSLQSRGNPDSPAAAALIEGRTRVESMALIHQDLYQDNSLLTVDLKNYISRLCQNLFSTYQVGDNQIALSLDISPVKLDVSTLIPIGLILNELITNALKYAFPNNRKGQIEVKLREAGDSLQLVVKDNGVGIMHKSNTGLGHRLVEAFAKKLAAQITVDNSSGTNVCLDIGNFKLA